MERHEAMILAGMVALKHASPAWTQEQLDVYAQLLDDLDYDLAHGAVIEWMRSESTRPEPSDIRRAVALAQLEDAGVVMLPPDLAWGCVVRWITRIGRSRPLPPQPALARQVALSMGWESLCNSDRPDVVRAQFERAYVQAYDRTLREAAKSPGARSPSLPKLLTPEPVLVEALRPARALAAPVADVLQVLALPEPVRVRRPS